MNIQNKSKSAFPLSLTQGVAKWQAKWSDIKGQDKQLLMGLLWLLALGLLWFLMWRPWSYIASSQNAPENAIFEELQVLQKQSNEAKALLSKPQLSASDSQAALNKITQNLLPQAQVSTLANAVTVNVQMAQSTDLANWIAHVSQDAQCSISEATLSRALSNQSGVFWSARFVLTLPHKP